MSSHPLRLGLGPVPYCMVFPSDKIWGGGGGGLKLERLGTRLSTLRIVYNRQCHTLTKITGLKYRKLILQCTLLSFVTFNCERIKAHIICCRLD